MHVNLDYFIFTELQSRFRHNPDISVQSDSLNFCSVSIESPNNIIVLLIKTPILMGDMARFSFDVNVQRLSHPKSIIPIVIHEGKMDSHLKQVTKDLSVLLYSIRRFRKKEDISRVIDDIHKLTI